MLELKELVILHNLRIHYVMIQSELKYFIGGKGVGTVHLELRFGSNPAKNPGFYVQSRYQPAKTARVGFLDGSGTEWN
jgi:hypothetical protein